jgi:Fic family protein
MYVEKSPIGNSVFSTSLSAERMMVAAQSPVDARTRERYLHWDRLRRLDPPEDLSSEEWWWKIKFDRQGGLRELPLRDRDGIPFAYGLPDLILKSLRLVDRHCSGEVAMDDAITSERGAQQRYLVNSLMEEAIRSSQLEGATTSRRSAKELLRSGREPKDRSERMILNNYRALQFMRSELGGPLSREAVLELHRIVTDGTLDDPSAAGRLQRPGEDRVAVYDRDDGRRIHVPPPAEELPERLQRLCDFANEDEDSERFVHPVIRAILLHFCLAYDHPFEDGNGRTARILFFWSMREQDYWLVEYLPISKILREAPAQYERAFLESETDGGDTTYFLLHQLQTIERAIEDLHGYLRRKSGEIREIEELIHGGDFNHRQLTVLSDALRHPDSSFSFGGHAGVNRVTHETARSDLSQLAKQGLLTRRRLGREYLFEPAPDLAERLKESPA